MTAVESLLIIETYDLWRKVLKPSLTSSKPWSGENGSSWTTAEKIKVVMLVLEVS